jgi:hypothetical protein
MKKPAFIHPQRFRLRHVFGKRVEREPQLLNISVIDNGIVEFVAACCAAV